MYDSPSNNRPPRTPGKKAWIPKPPTSSSISETVRNKRSSNDSTCTPSSVHLLGRSYGLARDDLSDLSGSCYNNAAAVIPEGDEQPWRHAQTLRRRLPLHPQPHADDESSVRRSYRVLLDKASVEVETIASGSTGQDVNRVPLLLILMDTQRKKYELMQLWMDPTTDTVKDVLLAVTRNSTNAWKQDYDGLFQVRNNHFAQLINVLSAGHYDVVPHEVWVAKPWSMSAKVTVSYASTLLNHLKRVGALEYKTASDFSSKWKQLVPKSSPKRLNDSILVLSRLAQQRLYVPEGILKHHHAFQFLSFAPPFEQPSPVEIGDASSSVASALSDSIVEEVADPLSLSRNPSRDFSDTDSTFSTTGTHSPDPKRPYTTKSIPCDASHVTRESAYMIRQQRNAPLRHYLPNSSSSGSSHEQSRISRLLNVLNCAKQQHSADSSGKPLLEPPPLRRQLPSPTRPVVDGSDDSSHASGVPLLYNSSDWVGAVSDE